MIFIHYLAARNNENQLSRRTHAKKLAAQARIKEKYFICLHAGDTCLGSEDIP